MGEMFICSKLGQNPSNIHVGTFARIKNLIWYQLQVTRLKLSRVKLYFRVFAKQGIFNALNKVLCLASAMECADGDNKIVFTGMPLW